MTSDLSSCSGCSLSESSGSSSVRGDTIVCHCEEVLESTVKTAVESGAESVVEVTGKCGAGGGCGACHVRIERVLRGMPAKCGSGRFDLCGDCGCANVICGCEDETAA